MANTPDTQEAPAPKPTGRYVPLPENEDKSLGEIYSECVEHLNEQFAFFVTHILNIGKPAATSAVPTACVSVDPKVAKEDIDGAFSFLFNQNFARSMNTEENSFVMAHETMHILLNHLKLCQTKKFTQAPDCTEECGKKKDKHDRLCSSCSSHRRKFNIAADCVINDYLVQQGFVPPVLSEDPKQGLCYGMNMVGFNCANSTVTDVFDALPEDAGKCDGNHSGDGEGDGCDGSCGESYPGAIDDHDWMHNSSEAEQDAAEAAGEDSPDDIQDKKNEDEGKADKSDMNPGHGPGGKQAFAKLNGVGLKWASLLEKINPFAFKHGMKPKVSWHQQPRKLAAVGNGYSRLPIAQDSNKPGKNQIPAIVMALDTSASIGQEQANQFVNMAKSVPDKRIKLFVCTFTTRYKELDLEDPKWDDGGTHFDPISQYIEDKVKPENRNRYPSAVIVVTDGQASFNDQRPNDAEAKAWYWLLTDPNRTEDWSGAKFPGHLDQLAKYQTGVSE